MMTNMSKECSLGKNLSRILRLQNISNLQLQGTPNCTSISLHVHTYDTI